MMPVPLYIFLYDDYVAKIVRWRLIDYKPKYSMVEYMSEASGRTIMLTIDEAWQHATPPP